MNADREQLPGRSGAAAAPPTAGRIQPSAALPGVPGWAGCGPACTPGSAVRSPSSLPGQAAGPPLSFRERRLLTSSKAAGAAPRPGNSPRWRRPKPRPGRRGGGDGRPRGPERRPRGAALPPRRAERPPLTRPAQPGPSGWSRRGGNAGRAPGRGAAPPGKGGWSLVSLLGTESFS